MTVAVSPALVGASLTAETVIDIVAVAENELPSCTWKVNESAPL